MRLQTSIRFQYNNRKGLTMSTQFKFATYSALVEAGEQASQETQALQQYLEQTSHGAKKRGEARTSEHRAGHVVKAKKIEKVAA